MLASEIPYRQPGVVHSDQAAGLRDLKHQRSVQIIAVTGGKGGVGKTNVSVNLALAMTGQGKQVMIMDADLGLANVDVMLGICPRYNLSHVLSGERRLEEVVVTGPNGLKIVPSSSGIKGMAELTPAQHAVLIRAFSELSFNLDVLLVDTAAGISDSVMSASPGSHGRLGVICDEPASMTDAYALIKLLHREHDIGRFRVLVNMVQSKQEGRRLYENLARVTDRYLFVELDYMGSVPYDKLLRKAVRQQNAVVEAYPDSSSSQQFKVLSRQADKWPVAESKGNVEFFIERLIQHSRTTTGESI
uniref:Cobyrinic acid a,c-diamide synthase/flagellar synthesis regulator FleN n=1 Tax=uncultured organism TaxID=155900 RepID=K7NA14_9ZZZZ|nr:cobyrinic acid a,c-diamide synthase/flagellar synthesis regulator FleN [uncultured organism]